MAKSSRSKWKKLHRRQKAKEESTNTVKRIKQLNRKLELTAKGGISAVPPQEPERRFHFLNPELDPHVPNTRKDLNNNYRAELNHVQYDYTRPLKLSPPKTNLYGKSNTAAPHPMTQNFETIDADAPIGGHALTKADMERVVRKAMEQEAAAAAGNNEEDALSNGGDDNSEEKEENDDGPEEYVFGMTDAAPRRAGKSAKKESGAVALKAKKSGGAAAAAAGSSSGAVKAAMVAAAAAAEEDAEAHLPFITGGAASAKKAGKITSMQAGHKKNGVTVSTGGAAKMKKVGSQGGASGTRVVSSGGKAAQKKTANTKAVSKKQ